MDSSGRLRDPGASMEGEKEKIERKERKDEEEEGVRMKNTALV